MQVYSKQTRPFCSVDAVVLGWAADSDAHRSPVAMAVTLDSERVLHMAQHSLSADQKRVCDLSGEQPSPSHLDACLTPQ